MPPLVDTDACAPSLVAAASANPLAVVTDGKIVTSRGAGTSLAFALHLAALLTTQEKANDIVKAICV